MRTNGGDPLVLERTVRSDGLTIARQTPPPGAASASATLIIPAGWAFDPPGGEGTARSSARLFTSGGGRRDRIALARHLDQLGGTLTPKTDAESAEVTVWGPKDMLPKLLEVLGDVVLRPRFTRADLDRNRRQIVEQQLRESRQPDHRAERELLSAVFPRGHPYSRTGLGTRATIRNLDPAKIRKFRRKTISTEGSFLVVTGGPSLAGVVRLAHKALGPFPTDRAPTPPTAPAGRSASLQSRDIPMEGRTQVEIRAGGAGVARSDPAYPGLFLADEVLGSRPLLSRLFQQVREARGLAYHASSTLESMRWGGYWWAQAGTGAERLRATTRALLAEVERIRSETIPQAELDRIRESAIGEIPLGLETPASAHELALDQVYHALPVDFYRRWPTLLRAVRPREIRRAAEEAMAPDRMVVIRAGPMGEG